MSSYYDDDTLDILEDVEFDELFESLVEDDDDYSLAESSRRRRSPKVAQGKGYVRPRMARKPISQTEFQGSLNRVGKDMKTNARAIIRQEQDINQIKKTLRRQQDMSFLTLFLNQHPPATVSTIEVPQDITEPDGRDGQTTVIPKGTKLVTDINHPAGLDNNLLPLLLMMNNNGQGGMGGDNNSLLPLLLLLTQQQGTAGGGTNLNTLLPLLLLMNQDSQ